MTDIQAALSLSQMVRLDTHMGKRNSTATRYRDLLAGLPLQLQFVYATNRSAFRLYVVQLHGGAANTLAKPSASMRKCGVGVKVHYMQVHLQPYYRQLGLKLGDFPIAERYAGQAIPLQFYLQLTIAAQGQVVQTLAQLLA